MMADLLSRGADLAVSSARDGQPLVPGTIVVAPPGHDIWVEPGCVRVAPAEPGYAPSPSIDRLLESLATSYGRRAVGVILSGTGSDGAHGLRSVKAAGGLTLVQMPSTARFGDMPGAAMQVAGPDLVLRAEQIGHRLSALSHDGPGWPGEGLPADEPALLAAVLAQLQRESGIDFSGYKHSTVQRQVQRRMAVRQVSSLADYLPILAGEEREAAALVQGLLVTVTSFFRDPDAFQALRQRLADYVARHSTKEQIRVWVPGCATGEEAYSIAMLVSEALGDPADLPRRLKVFGTDLDEGNLAVARAARYSPLALTAIPADLRQRYIVPTAMAGEISTTLRDCAVFARHNMLADPPFPRLDLVSCRNTLIYFQPAMQERALATIRYSLRPGGLLFLGASDALTPGFTGFSDSDAQYRIFARTGEAASLPVPVGSPHLRALSRPATAPATAEPLMSVPSPLHLELLRAFALPSLVIDAAGALVEAMGDVSAFCRVPEGRPPAQATRLIRPELQAEARALLLLARTGEPPVRGHAVSLADGSAVVLEARRVRAGDDEFRVISFAPDGAGSVEHAPTGDRDARLDREIERLERELADSQQTLQRSMAELEAVNEEMQASSEELQASSEELQASYEELQTANEELRATNDELASGNEQLRASASRLTELNDDLEGILSAVSQGLVLVDQDLLVTRFSPSSVRLFPLRPEDIGRSLLTVAPTMPVPGLQEALLAAMAGEPVVQIEVSGESGSFLIRVMGNRDGSGRSRGAIIAMSEVTELVALREQAETALADFIRLADALSEAVWRRDLATGELRYVSARITEIIGWAPADLLDQPDLLDACIDPADLPAVAEARGREGGRWIVDYRLVARDGRQRWVRESGTRGLGDDGTELVGILADITDEHEVAQRAADLALAYDELLRTTLMGVAMLDSHDRVLFANAAFARMTGHEESAAIGHSFSDFVASDAESDAGAPEAGLVSRRMRRRDGSEWWATVERSALTERPTDLASLVLVTDVSELRARIEVLSQQAQVDPLTGILNRRAFEAALEREVSRAARSGAPAAVVWVDLDGFKEVNDRYGHESGDEVLRRTASRLESVVRSNDVAGRLGGDEFGLVVGIADAKALDVLLERLAVALREPVSVGGIEMAVAGSIGVALYPDDATDTAALLQACDAAMYQAKAEGGDRVRYFRPAMNDEAEQRRRMRVAVARALSDLEFVLHYQPILSALDGSVWGVEAFVRWPLEGRVLSAAEFIPFCESSGQIRELGESIAAMLRADLDGLHAAAPGPLVVAMNLSVLQLTGTDTRVHEPAESARWRDLGVVVEVKESVFLPEHTHALQALEALSGVGTAVAIDDYGSGLTNFALLQSVSPRYLKLNSVIPDDGEVPEGQVRAAVGLAHALGARVVAEGVRDDDQRRRLAELGVDLAQGRALAPELPLADLREWLAARGGAGSAG